MVETRQIKLHGICPYCTQNYVETLELPLQEAKLTSHVIKPHEACPHFVAFVDPKGKIRATQTLDSIQAARKDLEAETAVAFFEEGECLFYHVKSIYPGTDLITSQNVEYHNLKRSRFYQEWIAQFEREGRHYGLFFLDNLIIVTILFFETIFTAGFPITDFHKDELLDTEIQTVLEYFKIRAIKMAEELVE